MFQAFVERAAHGDQPQTFSACFYRTNHMLGHYVSVETRLYENTGILEEINCSINYRR